MLDGTVLTDGDGVEVPVVDVVRGGTELLLLMKVGGKWQFAIPPEAAYGAAGRHPHVGPNESLVGIVKLVEIR